MFLNKADNLSLSIVEEDFGDNSHLTNKNVKKLAHVFNSFQSLQSIFHKRKFNALFQIKTEALMKMRMMSRMGFFKLKQVLDVHISERLECSFRKIDESIRPRIDLYDDEETESVFSDAKIGVDNFVRRDVRMAVLDFLEREGPYLGGEEGKELRKLLSEFLQRLASKKKPKKKIPPPPPLKKTKKIPMAPPLKSAKKKIPPAPGLKSKLPPAPGLKKKSKGIRATAAFGKPKVITKEMV